jgi:predicted nucleic acid-binding protein
MRLIVVDASVAVKWLAPFRPEEADVDKAQVIFERITRQQLMMIQPPHFVAEIMAVLSRIEPDYAERLFTAVSQIEMKVENSSEMYQTAIRLSIQLNHHLFDTLYHAVAIETAGATFITADETYYRKAQGLGHIELLQNYAG